MLKIADKLSLPKRKGLVSIPIETMTGFINQVNALYRWQMMEEAIVRLNPERSLKIIQFHQLMRSE